MSRAVPCAVVSCFALTLLMPAASQFTYPETRKSDTIDRYHGTAVPDPWRWLEDDNSPETAAWVTAQNKVTHDYFAAIPWRDKLRARMTSLFNYARVTAPIRRGDTYFFR